MLLVRRRAPEGGFFADGDRLAGVFGVLATGFSVLLGFIIFLAFESFDQSRSGAEQEALVLVQQCVGGLKPVAMNRSLRMIDEALGTVGVQVQVPCDALGRPAG